MMAVLHHTYMSCSCRVTASVRGVGKSSVSRWARNLRHCQPPRPKRHRASAKRNGIADIVSSIIDSDPFTTIQRIHAALQEKHDIHVSVSTVYRCLKELKISYKVAVRSAEHQPADPNHPFLTNEEDVYRQGISVDEACFISCDSPKRGWAARQHAVPKRPPKRRQTVSLLLAIDRTGVVDYEIKKGSFNTVSFQAFVERLPAGRQLIMDNVAFHRSKSVRDALTNRGSSIAFTPPYCPWFNPVEHAFSACKAAFRHKRVRRPSGAGFLTEDVVTSLTAVTAEKCHAFFDHTEKVLASKRAQISADKA